MKDSNSSKKEEKRKKPLSDPREDRAVAEIHRWAVHAGFIFRQLTGRDIGIDASLELPEDQKPSGTVFLQIKARRPLAGKPLTLQFKDRHKNYWLSQRLPVVLAVVLLEKKNHDPKKLFWIDFQALTPEKDYRLTGEGRVTFTLVRPKLRRKIFSCDVRANLFKRSVGHLGKWLRAVLIRQPEETIERSIRGVSLLLDVGKPDNAAETLESLPLWQTIVAERSKTVIERKTAKAFRRLGEPEKIEKLLRDRAVKVVKLNSAAL